MGNQVEFVPLGAQHWRWLARRAAPVLCADTKGIVALRGSRIVAAAAFDSWSHNACLAHIAIDDPMVIRHGFLEEICRYVFITADRGVMTGLTPADNEKALKFNRRVGFTEICRIQDGYKQGVDYVLQELRKENCRYLRDESEFSVLAGSSPAGGYGSAVGVSGTSGASRTSAASRVSAA